MEAIGAYPFQATEESELSFNKGDKILIVAFNEAKTWARAHDGNAVEGWVPLNYLSVKPHEWYKENCSKSKAEELLSDEMQPVGAFLLRDSESCPGDFTVSVKMEEEVKHFKVLIDTRSKYFLWVLKFDSINELIEYHRKSSVSRTSEVCLKDMLVGGSGPWAKALYDFDAKEAGELNFKKGDTVRVVQKIEEGVDWLKGELGGETGIFPLNYVKLVE